MVSLELSMNFTLHASLARHAHPGGPLRLPPFRLELHVEDPPGQPGGAPGPLPRRHALRHGGEARQARQGLVPEPAT